MNGSFFRTWLVPLLVMANLLAILFLFPFGTGYTTLTSPLGEDLWKTWTKTTPGALDFTYCLLVPVIVVYLILVKREELSRTELRGKNSALGWIIFGLVVFWIGSKSGKQLVGEMGLQFFLMGSVLWFWGAKVFRLLLFPWVFLIFAWPLPFMDSLVAFPLRMVVCFFAYHLLGLLGIPCLRYGTALYSAPDPLAGLAEGARFQIDIADPCSGIHSLLPLMMFSALYGYFFLTHRWQQWAIFFSVIPLCMVGNVVRILLLVIGCIQFGTAFALGTNETPSWFHEACGYAVFAVVLGLELLLARGLTALAGANPKPHFIPSALEERSQQAVPWWRIGTLLGLSAVMALLCGLAPTHYLLGEPAVRMSLPDQVTIPSFSTVPFVGSPAPIFDAERLLLPKDTQFVRKNYDDLQGHQLYFSVILGGAQGGLQQFSIHRPEVCLPSQGWRIEKHEDLAVTLPSGHPLMARSFLISRNYIDATGNNRTLRAIYMFSFVSENMTTPSYTNLVFWSGWDRFLHNRNPYWASVTTMSPLGQSTRANGLDEEQTRSLLIEFIRQVAPTVLKGETAGPISN